MRTSLRYLSHSWTLCMIGLKARSSLRTMSLRGEVMSGVTTILGGFSPFMATTSHTALGIFQECSGTFYDVIIPSRTFHDVIILSRMFHDIILSRMFHDIILHSRMFHDVIIPSRMFYDIIFLPGCSIA